MKAFAFVVCCIGSGFFALTAIVGWCQERSLKKWLPAGLVCLALVALFAYGAARLW